MMVAGFEVRTGQMMRVMALPVLAVLLAGSAGCAGAGDGHRPGTVRAEVSSAIYAPIAQARVDAAPLTEQEVFPAATLGAMKKESVTLTADCAAVVGADVGRVFPGRPGAVPGAWRWSGRWRCSTWPTWRRRTRWSSGSRRSCS